MTRNYLFLLLNDHNFGNFQTEVPTYLLTDKMYVHHPSFRRARIIFPIMELITSTIIPSQFGSLFSNNMKENCNQSSAYCQKSQTH